MRKPLVIASLLLISSVTVVASVPSLRDAAIWHLRAIAEPLVPRGDATDARFDDFYRGMVESMPTQQKAEAVLGHVVNQLHGAAEYLLEHAESWRGELERTPRWDALWLVARNSPRIEARLAALELHLAEAGIEKNSAWVDSLIEQVEANPERPDWGYFNLGALGARGVERERVLAVLQHGLTHEHSGHRRQAVEGLALLGGVEVIAPLLVSAEHDPDAVVRERAFCALASSGLLHLPERYLAVPSLIEIAERSDLPRNTRGWTFQALREISGAYDVPNEAAAWRVRMQQIGLL